MIFSPCNVATHRAMNVLQFFGVQPSPETVIPDLQDGSACD